MTLLEVCLDDIAGALIAQRCGADHIELCAGLGEGGTTPSVGTVATVLNSVDGIGVRVLVRQRPGDFVFSDTEVQAMCADIEAIRELESAPGVELGFALGALQPNGQIDRIATARLLRACGAASVTFHKAFDLTPDLEEALETLIDLGVERVLSSGGAPTALAGAPALAALVARSGGRIQILGAGGIRPHNVAEIVGRTGLEAVHFRAGVSQASASIRLDVPNDYDSGSRPVTSERQIAEMLAAMRAVGD